MSTPDGGTRHEPSYQSLPDLPAWNFDALKASIRRFGPLLPIVQDEHGRIIDGHQRQRAYLELGIKDYPILTASPWSEEEKRDLALILNFVRRRLTRKQLRGWIAAELRRTPDLSSNWLAQILGTTDKTVEDVRRELIATSEIPKLEQYRGKDGKSRRVARIVTHTAKQAGEARTALRLLGDEAPTKALSLRAAQRRASRKEKSEATADLVIEPPGDGDIRLYHCRFQELESVAGIEPESVNLVLTDIPYDGGFLGQVADLADFASRVLVDRGLLVTYCGQYHLDRVMRMLGERLTYRWPIAQVWRGDANHCHPVNVLSHWKPILVYSKGPWRRRGQWLDLSKPPRKEKAWHGWQQPLEEVEQLVRDFSDPGDLVVDPCGGGFTTAVASRNLGRRCIACDIDAACVALGQRRLAEGAGGEVQP